MVSELTYSKLNNKLLADLYKLAAEYKVPSAYKLSKQKLILALLKAEAEQNNLLFMSGVLDILPDGYGFLRPVNFSPSTKDIYVSLSQIKRFSLRKGDLIAGKTRPPKKTERYYSLLQVCMINETDPLIATKRPNFNSLTPLFPEEHLVLETTPHKVSTRIMDLISPLGKGQRGLIVSQPKAGKTLLLKEVANALRVNFPELKMFILLIDERPEEVTDMLQSVKAEVISSTFDELPQQHIKIAELVLERAQRLVEHHHDVVILLDSLTRLARAYNLTIPSSGRTLSGGIDPGALHKPKKFFGAARNVKEGGSLTILATAMVDTGSKMDDLIYEEFKGTGNLEWHLDRKLAELRVFPAVDIRKSGTRREELILNHKQQENLWALRRIIIERSEYTERFLQKLKQTKTNQDFLNQLSEQRSMYKKMIRT
ncbi:MAG: hypothetical protein RLZ12_131 [Bacillota bacterium]|jgi:transcription termination factor Rho